MSQLYRDHVSCLDRTCLSTPYSGLHLELNDRGEVFNVEVHVAFFVYGHEERTLAHQPETEHERVRALHRARVQCKDTAGLLNENCFMLTYDLLRHQTRRWYLKREMRALLSLTWTRSVSKRRCPDLAGLRERISNADAQIAEMDAELTATIECVALKLGRFHALKYVADGTNGLRPLEEEGWGYASMRSERGKLAAGRNENTRLSACYGSDEILVPFYLH